MKLGKKMKGAIVYGFDKVLINSNDKPIPIMVQVAKKFYAAGYQNIIISSRPKQIYYNFVISFLNKYQIPFTKIILKDIRDKRDSVKFKIDTIWGLTEDYNISLVYSFEPYVRRMVKEKYGINALPPEHLLVH